MLNARRRKSQKGFTLIELMIAVAILGVLAALAVPAFANYLARARISEAINYAQGCKAGVIEFAASKGALPANATQANCADIKTDNIAKVTVVGGSINVQLSKTVPKVAQDQWIRLQALQAENTLAANGSAITGWHCSITKGDTDKTASVQGALELVPATCRQGAL